MEAIAKRLAEIAANSRAGFESGLIEAGNYLLEKSLEKVPVKTGALKSSGFTEASGSGYGTVVRVGFGGEGAPYAPFVHEFSRKGRKFLEGPARANRSAMKKLVAEAVKPGSTARRSKTRPSKALKKALKLAKRQIKRGEKSVKRAAKKVLRAAKKATRKAVKAARRAARRRRK